MKTLKHNDIVHSTKFGADYMALVGTVKGYAVECNERSGPRWHRDPEQAEFDAINRRHAIAWANSFCGVIDNTGHAFRQHQARKVQSIALHEHELVYVEGVAYEVRLTRPGYQDMIQLRRV